MAKQVHDDILDNQDKSGPNEILVMVRWWELTRIVYNAILLLIITFNLVIFTTWLNKADIAISTVIYLIAANLFYCLGWGFEILFRTYFKTGEWPKQMRAVLFILGMLLASFVTQFLYPALMMLR